MVLVKFSEDSRPRPIRTQDILSCATNAPVKALVNKDISGEAHEARSKPFCLSHS